MAKTTGIAGMATQFEAPHPCHSQATFYNRSDVHVAVAAMATLAILPAAPVNVRGLSLADKPGTGDCDVKLYKPRDPRPCSMQPRAVLQRQGPRAGTDPLFWYVSWTDGQQSRK